MELGSILGFSLVERGATSSTLVSEMARPACFTAPIDESTSLKSPSWRPKKLQRTSVAATGEASRLYLRIIMLIRLMDATFGFPASFIGFPLYVAVKECHGMKTVRCWADPFTSTADAAATKSYSHEIVDCSRPSSRSGRRSSLSMKVYFFSSLALWSSTSSIPSYPERLRLSSPTVRCDAKPAPPRVVVSRCPQKRA
jgi:hypothetical protein